MRIRGEGSWQCVFLEGRGFFGFSLIDSASIVTRIDSELIFKLAGESSRVIAGIYCNKTEQFGEQSSSAGKNDFVALKMGLECTAL